MTGMNGMVNAPLRDRVERVHRDLTTYRTAEGTTDADEREIAIRTGTDSVQSVVGYMLMELTRLNEAIDSAKLDQFIRSAADSVHLTVGPTWFQSKRPLAEKEDSQTQQPPLPAGIEEIGAYDYTPDGVPAHPDYEDDGYKVVQIDTAMDVGRIRVYVNDGVVYDGDPEKE